MRFGRALGRRVHTRAERVVVARPPHHVFRVVSDVDRYPQFLPWCIGAAVRHSGAVSATVGAGITLCGALGFHVTPR
jgi:ribosome-associated toxin RatA of RatAB toxin-antitoxin module